MDIIVRAIPQVIAVLFQQAEFADAVGAIGQGRLLIDIEHPNAENYAHQRIFIIELQGYAYQVPYVIEPDGTHFLKAIFPSRTATKKYLDY